MNEQTKSTIVNKVGSEWLEGNRYQVRLLIMLDDYC